MKMTTFIITLFLSWSLSAGATQACQNELLASRSDYTRLVESALNKNQLSIQDLQEIANSSRPVNPFTYLTPTSENAALHKGFKRVLSKKMDWTVVQKELLGLLNEHAKQQILVDDAREDTKGLFDPKEVKAPVDPINARIYSYVWGREDQLFVFGQNLDPKAFLTVDGIEAYPLEFDSKQTTEFAQVPVYASLKDGRFLYVKKASFFDKSSEIWEATSNSKYLTLDHYAHGMDLVETYDGRILFSGTFPGEGKIVVQDITDPSKPITLVHNTLEWNDPLPSGRSTYFIGRKRDQLLVYTEGKIYVGRKLALTGNNTFKVQDGSVYFKDAKGEMHLGSKDGGSQPLPTPDSLGGLVAWHETESGEVLLLHTFINGPLNILNFARGETTSLLRPDPDFGVQSGAIAVTDLKDGDVAFAEISQEPGYPSNVRIWSLKTGKLLHEVKVIDNFRQMARSLSWSGQGANLHLNLVLYDGRTETTTFRRFRIYNSVGP